MIIFRSMCKYLVRQRESVVDVSSVVESDCSIILRQFRSQLFNQSLTRARSAVLMSFWSPGVLILAVVKVSVLAVRGCVSSILMPHGPVVVTIAKVVILL